MRPASRLLPPRLGAFFETARRFGGRGNDEARLFLAPTEWGRATVLEVKRFAMVFGLG